MGVVRRFWREVSVRSLFGEFEVFDRVGSCKEFVRRNEGICLRRNVRRNVRY